MLDFGLAIEEEFGRPLADANRRGTRHARPISAPETVGGEIARPDAQSDVYSLGRDALRMPGSAGPFDAPTPVRPLSRGPRRCAARAARLIRPCHADLAVVTGHGLERDRSRRYRSAAALADDLERASRAGRSPRGGPAARPRVALARREPRLAAAISAAIVIAIGGFAWISVVAGCAAEAIAEKNKDLSTRTHLAEAKVQAEAKRTHRDRKGRTTCSVSRSAGVEGARQQADTPCGRPPGQDRGVRRVAGKAKVVVEGHARHPGLKDHEAKLAEIRLRAKPPAPPIRSGIRSRRSSAAFEFEIPKDRWWHAQLSELVLDLEGRSQDEKTGLFSEGTSESTAGGKIVRRRLERRASERSSSRRGEALEGSDRRDRDVPEYRGMVLAPQLGLLPIGPDPESDCGSSFTCIGRSAERGADGKLVVNESMGWFSC